MSNDVAVSALYENELVAFLHDMSAFKLLRGFQEVNFQLPTFH